MDFKHVSVLLQESIEALNIKEDGIYVDCTLGGGGHAFHILKRLSKKGKLIGIDQDQDALKAAQDRLKEFDNLICVHNNFYNIDAILKDLNIEKVDGILMDLGVSSYQLDTADRGFSYMKDAPLDMRMNRDEPLSACDVVNNYSEEEITKVIRDYGEDKFARNIARNIVKKREPSPIKTTLELVEIIRQSIPLRLQKDGHPAKRTFQAIRIEVNRELGILDQALEDGIRHLNPGGRMAIITFHSLEDRKIKVKFRDMANPCICPPDFPVCACGKTPEIRTISRKPIEPSKEEQEINSRSRSAKLRVVEKL